MEKELNHPPINFGKTGALIINLGTPDSTSWFDIRKYLKEFLSDKENLRKQIKRYLNIFKDHPYVFNLGHGILPETEVDMVYELVETVRNYK